MIPHLPIRQIGSYAAYYVCENSPNWRRGFMDFVAEMVNTWGVRGFIFDQAVVTVHNTSGLCFNPLHTHRPDEQLSHLVSALVEAKQFLRDRWGDALSILSRCSAARACGISVPSGSISPGIGPPCPVLMKRWRPSTWPGGPRARQCIKCTDQISQINKIFTAGYWIDLYLEEGGARLGHYPELTAYLQSLAEFKKHFLKFLSQRDAYLHTMHIQVTPEDTALVRLHRTGDEALVLVTHPQGLEASVDLVLDLAGILGPGEKHMQLWSRTLDMLDQSSAQGSAHLQVHIPAQDFVAIHLF